MSYKYFPYQAVKLPNGFSGKEVRGFKFPAGDDFRDDNAADVENLQQFHLYFGVHTVFASLDDIMRTGSTKTNKVYAPMIEDLKDSYNKLAIYCLSEASKMVWVPDRDNAGS